MSLNKKYVKKIEEVTDALIDEGVTNSSSHVDVDLYENQVTVDATLDVSQIILYESCDFRPIFNLS